MSRPRPFIGITSYVEPASWGAWREVPAALVPYAYVAQVSAAGGIPVVLPPLPGEATEADAQALLALLDGLLLTGGPDLDPARYGERPHPTVQAVRPERDASELLLAGVTAEEDVPVLGVCRGMQVMAVAAGGALTQHLPDLVGTSLHSPGHGHGHYGSHVITVKENTRLYEILGSQVTVATYHHQGVADAATYQQSAWADDGVVEALEDRDAVFRLGVQWHPETGDDPRLFEALVAAAANRRAGRHRGADPL